VSYRDQTGGTRRQRFSTMLSDRITDRSSFSVVPAPDAGFARWRARIAVATCHGRTLLHSASLCFTLLHSASLCFTLLHSASLCFTLLHSASLCFTLLHAASRCFTLLHAASRCFTLLHPQP
jgi:hypothetical protein